jgi:hypothetical protein
LAVVSLAVMPVLSWGAAPHRESVRLQRRGGRLHADADVPYLSAVLLVGLVLNATLGWSWVNPIAGLVIAAVAGRKGHEAWRGGDCCAPTAPGPWATRLPPPTDHPPVDAVPQSALPQSMQIGKND